MERNVASSVPNGCPMDASPQSMMREPAAEPVPGPFPGPGRQQELLPEVPLVGDTEGRPPRGARVARQRPRVPGVHRQHLGDEIRDERAERQDQRGLVAGADPVGLEPDPAMGAIGFEKVIGDDV
jgi:hypothetical protein